MGEFTSFVVPEERLRDLESIRTDGGTKMWDRIGVQVIANRLGFYRLVVYLENNRDRYGEILHQFGEWKKGQGQK